MRVAEYRDLIGGLEQAVTSHSACINAQERARGADWLRRAGSELLAAECPRATATDRSRAERMLDRSASILQRVAP